MGNIGVPACRTIQRKTLNQTMIKFIKTICLVLVIQAQVFADVADTDSTQTWPTAKELEPRDADEPIVKWYLRHYKFLTMTDSVYTFDSEFIKPDGFHSLPATELSPFQNWVANLPLWHKGKPAARRRGGWAYNREELARVVHLPFEVEYLTDISAPLHILAEYYRFQGWEFRLEIFGRGQQEYAYQGWLKGRLAFNSRSEMILKPAKERQANESEYIRFFSQVMGNANFFSLKRNCHPISALELAPGDILIAHNERLVDGRVYIVLHVLENSDGERLFAVAKGCREACDFHIPNFNSDRTNPWITVERIEALAGDFPNSGFYRLNLD